MNSDCKLLYAALSAITVVRSHLTVRARESTKRQINLLGWVDIFITFLFSLLKPKRSMSGGSLPEMLVLPILSCILKNGEYLVFTNAHSIHFFKT